MLSPSPAVTGKFCCNCGDYLPLESFGFKVKGQPTRRSRCQGCYNGYMTSYRQHQRAKRLRKVVSALRRSPGLTRTEALAAAALRQFGGLNGLCRQWKEHLDAAPVGSRTASTLLDVIFRLSESAHAARRAREENLGEVVRANDDPIDDEDSQRVLKQSVQRCRAAEASGSPPPTRPAQRDYSKMTDEEVQQELDWLMSERLRAAAGGE